MNRIHVLRCAAVSGLLASNPAWAQADTAAGSETLAPIEVESVRLNTEVLETPAAVDVIEGEDVTRGRRKTQLDDALNRTPGVYANNGSNFAQNCAVDPRRRRALGLRARGVRADASPKPCSTARPRPTASTSAPSSAWRCTRRSPPSTATPPAASSISPIPHWTAADRGELAAGSNGYRRASVSSARQLDDWGYAITASRLDLDGYREHSEVEKISSPASSNARRATPAPCA